MIQQLKIFSIAIACGTAAMLAAQQPGTDSAGSVAAGEALFFGKAGCARCHEVNGRGRAISGSAARQDSEPQ